MSAIADALQSQIVSELLTLRGRSNPRHITDIIINAPKTGYDLEFDESTSAIRIDFREPTFLGSAVGGDASRFAAAAFSSFQGVIATIENSNTLSWSLVRIYYSAFYAGHAIIRFLGRSCSYIEANHLAHILRLADAIGNRPSFKLSSGLYSCQLNITQTGIQLIQARGRVGGAHESFWEMFDALLSEVTEDVLLSRIGPSDARAVFFKLNALQTILRRGAGASWLSTVRNEIQYRHARGVWAPSTVNRTQRGVLSRLADQWTRDPMAIDIDLPPGAELGAFVAACAFLTALCREILYRIAERSTAGSNSFARAPLTLCSTQPPAPTGPSR